MSWVLKVTLATSTRGKAVATFINPSIILRAWNIYWV